MPWASLLEREEDERRWLLESLGFDPDADCSGAPGASQPCVLRPLGPVSADSPAHLGASRYSAAGAGRSRDAGRYSRGYTVELGRVRVTDWNDFEWVVWRL